MIPIALKIVQVVLSFGLINVWIIRFHKPTEYRGGNARTMKEEFAVYGLPQQALYIVGGLKLIAAALFIIGIWLPLVIAPTAAVVGILMIGAIFMHLKVRDPMIRFVPAASVFLLCLFVFLSSI